VDDELIGFLIWIVIIVVAGLWKLLSKVFGSAATIRKVAEAGKETKSLLDTLMGGDFEELKKALQGQGEAKPKPPIVEESTTAPSSPRSQVALPQTRPPGQVLPRPQPTVVRGTARQPDLAAEQRRRQRAKTEGIRPSRAPQPSGEEGVPSPEEGPKRRVAPPVAAPTAAAESKPVVEAAKEPRPALALLRGRDPRTLRELMILREILGPPRAFTQQRGRGIP